MKQPIRPQSALLVLLIAGVFITYWSVRENGFIRYDDDLYILNNPHVSSGLSIRNFEWAFTAVDCANYHPLTWLSHQADVAVFGMNPGAHHIVSLIWHLINTLLLFVLFRQVSGNQWLSAGVAALWALHPLRVESVAWAAERKDLLCGFFWLSALLAYIEYQKNRSRKTYAATLLLFALGLLSKPMIVTLPVVFLLFDFWYRKSDGYYGMTSRPEHVVQAASPPLPRLIAEKVPFFALSFGLSIVAVLTQKSGAALVTFESYPFPARIMNATVSCFVYLLKMAWPARLALFYPYPAYSHPRQILFSALALTAVTVAAIYYSTRRPWMTVGWFWYLVSLLPVIGIIQVGDQAYADRYTYLPSIGIYLIILILLSRINFSRRSALIATVALFLTATTLLAARTRRQVRFWKDCETVFTHSILVTGNNFLAQGNLGLTLLDNQRYDEAMGHLRQAIALCPRFADAINNMGVAFEKTGRLDSAARYFDAAVRITPKEARTWSNLGSAYQSMDSLTLAIETYERALSLDTANCDVYNNLGVCYLRAENLDKAEATLTRCLTICPDSPLARLNRARLYFKMNRIDSARNDLDVVTRAHPNDLKLRAFVDDMLNRNQAR